MTNAVVSHDVTEAEWAPSRTTGFKLSRGETLFFECVIDALRDHGVRPPKRFFGIPIDVRRVVDYDHVKLLVAARLADPFDATAEGRLQRSQQLKTALKRTREALMNFKVIGASNPFVWYTGKPIRGFDLLPVRLPSAKH
jgi:hypothetical protein